MATNPGAATSNLLVQTTGVAVNLPNPNDPVEQEYKKLLEDDDTALAEVDQMMKDNAAATTRGQGVSSEALDSRIEARLASMRGEYEEFLKRHPDHARARIAFGSFLNDTKDEDGARAQYELALQLDPRNPAAWNNLANLYGHSGPVSKMFEYYGKAIDLNPLEPVYYENLATAVYLYRKDACAYYHFTNDQPVFDKSLALYHQALVLDPTNFALASELAESYYGIKPTRTEDALNAWSNALQIAQTGIEREGVYIHLARFKVSAGRFDEARQDLDRVSEPELADLKERLLRNLALREYPQETNSLPIRVICPSGRPD